MRHGDVRERYEVYCAACLTWFPVEGDDPADELREHEDELHD